MAIISPNAALYEYIFAQTGTTLTEQGQDFLYFEQPPEDLTMPYIWCNVNTLSDIGPRDGYIYQMLAEFTVVAFGDVNRSNKAQLLLGQTALLKLFTPRALNVDFTTASGDSVRLISQTLSSLEEGTEELGQKTLNFAKVNINFTITF